MYRQSLNEIMNQMAGRLDTIKVEGVAGHDGVLKEAAAYASIDPVLGGLYKMYREALATSEELQKSYGQGSPMQDVSAEWLASAASSLLARIEELEKAGVRDVLLRQLRDEIEGEAIEASQSFDRKMQLFYRQQLAFAKMKRAGEDSFLMVMLMFWILQSMLADTRRRLTAVSAFSAASLPTISYGFATAH